jgi:glutaredoxin 3
MMLTIYSKTVCPYCVNAKNYLKNKNISFREVNIEENDEARSFMQSQGHRSVPQIYLNGRLFVEGGWAGLSKMSAEEILNEIELRTALLNQSL